MTYHKCLDCGHRIETRYQRCWTCFSSVRPKGKRPIQPCPNCGVMCRGKQCWECYQKARDIYDEAEVALTGGRWVLRGSRRVWVTTEEEVAAYAQRPEVRRELLNALTAEITTPSVWWSRSSAKKHRAKKRAAAREEAA